MVPSPNAKSVLSALVKTRIIELSRDLELRTERSATKDRHIEALLRSKPMALPDILRALARDELKRVCRAHGLDSSGRARQTLIDRLLGGRRAESDVPPTSKRPNRVMPVRGDIVEVRLRQYIVSDVAAQNEGEMTSVQLVCLDDDAQGRELSVLWELELGARVVSPDADVQSAVDHLDEPRTFAAYYNALKWHRVTARDANLFQAPFRAGIALKDYQLAPLMKALELPRANLFIADDVGLGKTIEAGLVLQELLLRQRVDWALILCPAAVTLQWKDEMEKRFGLRFEIFNRDFVAKRREERGFSINPWSTHHRFIVSYQTFRRPEYREPLLHLLGDKRKKSLLILDEAHTAAPSASAAYAVDSNVTGVVRELTGHFENRLFLSATPHNGHSNSFSALLEMLDPQRFMRGAPISGPEELAPVLVRRLKSDLAHLGARVPKRRVIQRELTHDGTRWLERAVSDDGSVVTTTLADGPAPELELSAMLANYTSMAAPHGGPGRRIFIYLQKRLLSSIPAFLHTLEKHAQSVLPAGLSTSDEADDTRVADAGDDESAEGASAASHNAREQARHLEASRKKTKALSPEAHALLTSMLALARRMRSQPDAKAHALLAWVRANMCPGVAFGGARGAGKALAWTDTRLIVFTEYGHTKQHLVRLLAEAFGGTDRGDERLAVFDGGMSEDARHDVQRAFNDAKSPVRLLIATDAAREGVNLQGHCADLMHLDLPWNPARVEQRNGRIDRTLQDAPEVRCSYFVYPARTEDRVLATIVRKIGDIQAELGSMGAVVMDDVTRVLDGGIGEGTLDDVAKAEDAARTRSQSSVRELESTRRLDRLKAETYRAEELRQQSFEKIGFDSHRLREVLDVALGLSGAKKLEPCAPAADEPDLACFTIPELGVGWEMTLDSVRPPRERDEPVWRWRGRPLLPVVFDPPTRLGTPVAHLHLAHPLVQRLLSRLFAQGYAAHDLSRVTVVRPKQARSRVLGFARVGVFGDGAVRLHDDLIGVAGRFRDLGEPLVIGHEKGDREAVERVEELLADSTPLASVPKVLQDQIRTHAAAHFAALWPALLAEADAVLHDVEQDLTRRGREEAAALATILDDQAIVAKRAIALIDQRDPRGLDAQERQQLNEERAYLTRRLAHLPNERATEVSALESHYKVLQRRVERVGLVYVLPATR
jgi:hypothetical protein